MVLLEMFKANERDVINESWKRKGNEKANKTANLKVSKQRRINKMSKDYEFEISKLRRRKQKRNILYYSDCW